MHAVLNQLNQLPDGLVVVSGASRGIGRELVNLLLASGMEVVELAITGQQQVCASTRGQPKPSEKDGKSRAWALQ